MQHRRLGSFFESASELGTALVDAFEANVGTGTPEGLLPDAQDLWSDDVDTAGQGVVDEPETPAQPMSPPAPNPPAMTPTPSPAPASDDLPPCVNGPPIDRIAFCNALPDQPFGIDCFDRWAASEDGSYDGPPGCTLSPVTETEYCCSAPLGGN